MDKDIIDRPFIDGNFVSYEKFFDHEWCKRIFDAVEISPLADAVNTLIVAWRSTNGAHILPRLMAESLRAFADGGLDGNLRCRANYSDKVVKGLVGKLVERMQYHLNFDQRSALKRAVSKIEEEAHQAIKTDRAEVRFDVSEYWDFLVHSSEFQFCILGIQRINYGSLYFAYEDFLANVVRVKGQNHELKMVRFDDALPKHFGKPLTEFCWKHEEVDLARLVRNALANDGGRFGESLEKYQSRFVDVTDTDKFPLQGHLFNLVDGKIQIIPDNTRHLFGVLKDRVTKIVEQLA